MSRNLWRILALVIRGEICYDISNVSGFVKGYELGE